MKRIIYDFGANNGDDIPYYLLKSDLVVAVEANPLLCEFIKDRFKDQISAGNLVVENCVLSTEASSKCVDFFIHKIDHVLSQFPRPDNLDDFEKVSLPSKYVLEIIQKYGNPHYIKIDIEHYDQRWIQVRSATRFKDCIKTSLGVLNPNLFLGRLFS